jgi:hypothetical protein
MEITSNLNLGAMLVHHLSRDSGPELPETPWDTPWTQPYRSADRLAVGAAGRRIKMPE